MALPGVKKRRKESDRMTQLTRVDKARKKELQARKVSTDPDDFDKPDVIAKDRGISLRNLNIRLQDNFKKQLKSEIKAGEQSTKKKKRVKAAKLLRKKK